MTDISNQVSELQSQIENDPTYVSAREQIKAKQAELKAELKALGEKFFKEQTAKLFEEYPELGSFRWAQYTPYFNDGETCEFGVNSDYIRITGVAGEEFEELYLPTDKDGNLAKWYVTEETPDLDTWIAAQEDPAWALYATERASSLIEALDEDVLLSLFGDHAEVTVSREGVEVEWHEHE